jgi:hypothetical protein
MVDYKGIELREGNFTKIETDILSRGLTNFEE